MHVNAQTAPGRLHDCVHSQLLFVEPCAQLRFQFIDINNIINHNQLRFRYAGAGSDIFCHYKQIGGPRRGGGEIGMFNVSLNIQFLSTFLIFISTIKLLPSPEPQIAMIFIVIPFFK